MDTSERITRYQQWLDEAEGRVVDWLERSRCDDSEKPADLRPLGAAVVILRRIIDIRKILAGWTADEQKGQFQEADPPSEEEILALMAECDPEESDPFDEGEMSK